MLFKILATAFLAIGVAGIVLLLNKLTRNSLPKWALPAGIALAIIGYQVFDDYNWHARKIAGLKQADGEFVVVGEYEAKSIMKPWRLVKPAITRIDTVNITNNKPMTGNLFENTIGSARQYGGATALPFVFDCDNEKFTPNLGDPSAYQWGPMPAQMIEGLCQ